MTIEARQSRRVGDALRRFLATPLDDLLAPRGDPAGTALALFSDVAATVPAYRDFLAEHDVDPDEVRTAAAFAELPMVTKDNYLSRHPLARLCRGGRLESCDFIAVSSGSTGTPTFWPRFLADELPVAARFEQVFADGFAADRRPTLAVVCFALGTWVGGMFTAGCCRHLAAKGYPITTVTPGSNRDEIWRVVRELAPQFEQTVLLGSSVDLCHTSASLYGTADAGVLGAETPLSICIRRFLAVTPEATRQLFGQSRLPTLVQYDPFVRYFETVPDGDGGTTLLFTGDNGVPLVRYHIADNGGVIGYREMLSFLADWGLDPVAELGGIVRDQPFAFVFGRADFTVS